MGIVIGRTKDDIIGMILEIYWSCDAASGAIVAEWLFCSYFNNYTFLITLLSLIKLLNRYKSNI